MGVMVIAEAGVNHNGSVELAKKLVDVAKQAGADAVKFQTFIPEKLVSRFAPKAAYQNKTTNSSETQLEMVQKLELGRADHLAVAAYCHDQNIQFLSTPFDQESADFLDEIGMPIFKLSSGEVTNFPFLKHVALKNKPIILSTGMSTLDEVKEAVKAIVSTGHSQLTLLHCVTEYPAPFDQVNLFAMKTLRETFGLRVGYSDHTPGLEIAFAAVALGAEVIEKHLTLNKSMPGPDHQASLDPGEFASLVLGIRHVEVALGDGIKRPAQCELENRNVVRKSVVAARFLKKGVRIQPQDLLCKRPGMGLLPKTIPDLVGKILLRNLEPDEYIFFEDVT